MMAHVSTEHEHNRDAARTKIDLRQLRRCIMDWQAGRVPSAKDLLPDGVLDAIAIKCGNRDHGDGYHSTKEMRDAVILYRKLAFEASGGPVGKLPDQGIGLTIVRDAPAGWKPTSRPPRPTPQRNWP